MCCKISLLAYCRCDVFDSVACRNVLDQATLAVPAEDGGLLEVTWLVLSGRLLFGPRLGPHRRVKDRDIRGFISRSVVIGTGFFVFV